MSMMILHNQNETNWNSLGYGPLNDAINPKVTRARNAEYTLEFSYPVNGPLFDNIKTGNWVVTNAGTKAETENQRFEIQTVTKPINGIVSVYAEHYRYQLLRAVLKYSGDFTGNVNEVLKKIISISLPNYDFTVKQVLRTSNSTITLSDPTKFENTMAALGGTTGSTLDLFGGEYIFNNNEISLPERSGVDTQVVIAYGKNIQDISQEESIENVFTSIYPWAKYTPENGGEEQIITLSESYLDSEYVKNYRGRRIESVDFSNSKPKNAAELRQYAQAYIKNNDVGLPKVSIKTSFVDLAKSLQDGDISQLEAIDLCDNVTVAFNELGISTTAKITKVVWRPDLDQFESVELGDAKTSLGDVIHGEIPDPFDPSDLVNDIRDTNNVVGEIQNDLDNFTDILNNPGEGHVVIYPSMSDPQEIYIMDTTNITTAKKMWRWNESGLAYSKTGRNGPWTVGMNKDGQIVADLITTGTLRAIDIIGVTITGSVLTSTGSTFTTVIKNGLITWSKTSGSQEVAALNARIYSSNSLVYIKLTNSEGFEVRSSDSGAYTDAYFGVYKNGGKTWLQGRAYQVTFMPILYSTTPSGVIYNHTYHAQYGDGDGNYFSANVSITVRSKGDINLYGNRTAVNGSLIVTKDKNAVHNTKYGVVATPAYETTKSYLGDIGENETGDNNLIMIRINPIFLETINTTDYSYQVFLTQYSDSSIWIKERHEDYFIVESEKPNAKFSWELKALRLGYEEEYLKKIENLGEDVEASDGKGMPKNTSSLDLPDSVLQRLS